MDFRCQCSFCTKRLFDVEDNATGVIIIKCPRCRKIVRVNLGSIVGTD